MDFRRGIKEVVIDGEEVCLRKNAVLGWGVVHPYKNKDGTWNIKNLITGGSWIKLFITIFIVLMLLGAIFEYKNLVDITNECLNKSKILNIKW